MSVKRDKFLEQIRAKSDNGKATKEQVYGALEIITKSGVSRDSGLYFMGIDSGSIGEIDANLRHYLAMTVLTSAILGIEIDELDPDDEW